MRLTSVSVRGLFDRFNHDLHFNLDDHVTIMIGPNGFGKTVILRTLNSLFNLSMHRLNAMPFRELTLRFDDHSTLLVARRPSHPTPRPTPDLTSLSLIYSNPASTFAPFTPRTTTLPEDLRISLNRIDDYIPELTRIGRDEWSNSVTGEVLDLNMVYERYSNRLPVDAGSLDELPDWLRSINESIPVRLIDTERLTQPIDIRSPRIRSPHNVPLASASRTVEIYSGQLSREVQDTLATYATLSQSLDRTFPSRVVQAADSPSLSSEQLDAKLAEVESKRTNIAEAGLLHQDEARLDALALRGVDDSKRVVLEVYAQDALEKLNVFDDLYYRVNTFKRLANERLLYKSVSVSEGGLTVEAQDGSPLQLDMLSSGEQHELVLLYDLLFAIQPNALVLVDEPELSLHVAWQEAILTDLQQMASLSNFHVLLATHSPQVIGDRWDLTIELKGPPLP